MAIILENTGPGPPERYLFHVRTTPPDGGAEPWEAPKILNLYHVMKTLRARGCQPADIRAAVERVCPEYKGAMEVVIEKSGEGFAARRQPWGGGEAQWTSPAGMTEDALSEWLAKKGMDGRDIWELFEDLKNSER